MSRRSRLYALAGVLGVALIAVVVAIAFTGGSKEATTTSQTTPSAFLAGVRQSGDTLGKASAVPLLVFEDPQCPYCREWSLNTLPHLVEKYVKTGRVKLVWMGIPIVGQNSIDGLTAAYAAANQDKLWNVVDQLYQRQGAENTGWITEPTLRDAAAAAGADGDRMLKDANTEPVAAKIAAAESAANAHQVGGTPSFVVRGRLLPLQSLDPSSFDTALDDALAQ